MLEKIYVYEDGKKHEAKGEELEYYLSWIEEINALEAANKEKAEKKKSAANKLKTLGLTDSEVEALLG
jgi:hypothetical protein